MTDAIRFGASPIHGLGVIAEREFRAGEVIEECPVIFVAAQNRPALDQTELFEYYFDWEGDGAVALGCGSLYSTLR